MNSKENKNLGDGSLGNSTREEENHSKEELPTMSIMDHLTEFRKMILYFLVGIFVASIVAYAFIDSIMLLFNNPFSSQFTIGSLIGTGPAEAFIIKLKMAIFSGIILSSPYLFYHLWLFLSPALYQEEKNLLLYFVALSSVLFLIGVCFAYYVVLPVAYQFFYNQYLSIDLSPTIKISEHLSTVSRMLLAFGFVFEIPVLSILLAKAKIINSSMMLSAWRYVVVAGMLVSAILTPPDVFSLLLLAGPIILLYFISIYLVKLIEAPKDIKN